MKRLFASVVALSFLYTLQAQNIGIGITTPRAKFHVFNGASGNVTPFAPMAVEGNGNTYLNLLSPDANETALLFGNSTNAASGGIIYNNASTLNGLQFRTGGNQTRMVITSNGNVGIGTTTPGAPLSFSSALGRKITLYPGQSGIAGFAVESNRLEIYTHSVTGDIAFGYDLFNNFYERFSIKANGALAVNGNSGLPGQVLQSNGNGASPSWTDPTTVLSNNTFFIQSNTATLINSNSSIALPFSHTFTTDGAKVLITFSFQTFTPSCFACGPTTLYLDIELNGSERKRFVEDVPNNAYQVVAGNYYMSLAAGTYTISFAASRNGPNITVGHVGLGSHAIIQVIPL